MTKIYPLIYLNNYRYMMSKEGKFLDKNVSILASDDETLNLPLLPSVLDEMTIDHAFELTKPFIKNEDYRNLSKLLKRLILKQVAEAYKAASSKKYTEEDIIKFYKHVKTHTFAEAMALINPQPIAVEVEMNQYCQKLDDGVCCYKENCCPTEPKVVNNIIQVVKWIYE